MNLRAGGLLCRLRLFQKLCKCLNFIIVISLNRQLRNRPLGRLFSGNNLADPKEGVSGKKFGGPIFWAVMKPVPTVYPIPSQSDHFWTKMAKISCFKERLLTMTSISLVAGLSYVSAGNILTIIQKQKQFCMLVNPQLSSSVSLPRTSIFPAMILYPGSYLGTMASASGHYTVRTCTMNTYHV